MTSTANAVVLNHFGQPVETREIAIPDPPEGGVVLDNLLGGICGTDVHLQAGHLPIPTPLVLGHEGLGRVQSVSDKPLCDSAGTPLLVGDRVMWASSIACGICIPCRLWGEPTLCDERHTYGVNRPLSAGSGLSGSWATHIALQAGTTVVKVPAEVTDDEAISLACAGPTLVHAYERRPVRLGETVVVQGSGPVGLAAAAFAQMSGARHVVVLGGPAERLELAARAGIGHDHLEVAGTGVDQAEALERAFSEIQARTQGRGADLVVECAGVPAAFDQGLRMVRRSGSYLIVGQYTDSGDVTMNPHQIVYRQLNVVGSWAFSGAHLVRYVERLPAMVRHFDLASLVTRFEHAGAEEALAAVRDGSVMKAVFA
ncbi:hypothetical protein CH275_16455 [Rhodococcus sp. 06-235-1A]|uniref:zinc-binding dehydrogenase n=1 Tax=Rhodococcus sp. 06-235-1A TaxID=2022508 RepID=UPI000B9C18C0|nr:zinc-binding dehydrogenase [Rhodococcus sp. 06-235-1A]OZD03369.1 hypothetical protein CH275_16455 [Rhodococcus sp. 06-235-1A]